MDHEKIIKEAMNATRVLLGKYWRDVKPYAEIEFRKFIMDTELLAKLKISGEIFDDELKRQIIIKRTNLSFLLLNTKGISLLMAQEIMNAVENIVAKEVFKSFNIILPI